MRRIRFMLAATIAVLALGGAPVPGATARTHAVRTQSVTVKMKEFKFVLSPLTVHPGTVVFRLLNVGKLPHDLQIAGKRSAAIKPGKRGTLTVILKKGRYPYRCTLPGHADAGMKGVLRVA